MFKKKKNFDFSLFIQKRFPTPNQKEHIARRQNSKYLNDKETAELTT
jgi:hypothetical protein